MELRKKIVAILLVLSVLFSNIGVNVDVLAYTSSASVNGVNFSINNAAIQGDSHVLTGHDIVYNYSYVINGNGTVDGAKLVFDIGEKFDYVSVSADNNYGEPVVEENKVSIPFKSNDFHDSISGSVSLKVKFKAGQTVDTEKETVKVSFVYDGGEICAKNSEIATAKVNANQRVEIDKKLNAPKKPALDQPVSFDIIVTPPKVYGGLNMEEAVVSDTIENAQDVYISDDFDYNQSSGVINTDAIQTFPQAEKIEYVNENGSKKLVVYWAKRTFEVSDYTTKYSVTYKYKSSGELAQGGQRSNTAKVEYELYGSNDRESVSDRETITFYGAFQGDSLSILKSNRAGALSPDEYFVAQQAKWYISGIKNEGNTPLKELTIIDNMPNEFVRLESINIGQFTHPLNTKVILVKGDNTEEVLAENITLPTEQMSSDLSYQNVDINNLDGSKDIKAIRIIIKDDIPVGFKQVSSIIIKGKALKPTDEVTNSVSMSAKYIQEDGSEKTISGNSNASIKIVGAKPFYEFKKDFTSAKSQYHLDDPIDYTITVANHEYATGDITGVDIIDELDTAVFRDYEFVEAIIDNNVISGTLTHNGNPLTNSSSLAATKTEGSKNYYKYTFNGKVPAGRSFKLKFRVKIKDASVRFGNKKSPAYLMLKDIDGNDPSTYWVTKETVTDDTLNVDSNNLTTKHIKSILNIYNAFSGSIEAMKESKIVGSDNYSKDDKTITAGDRLQYRIRVGVKKGNGPIAHIVVVEELPKKDKNGSTLSPFLIKESADGAISVDTTGVHSGSIGDLKTYYTTLKTPNLDRLNDPVNNGGENAPSGWSEALPTDVSKVTYIMYDFHDYVFENGDYAGVKFELAVPNNANVGDVIKNTFIYNAGYPVENDNGKEYISFGKNSSNVVKHTVTDDALETGLGDRVWFDKNRNGLQDDGETGINGVKVELYDYGTDGNANPTKPIATRLTGTDRNGKKGHYLIKGLDSTHKYDLVYKVPTGEDTEFEYPKLKATIHSLGDDEKNSDFAYTQGNYTEDGYKSYSYSAAHSGDKIQVRELNKNLDFGLYKNASINVNVKELIKGLSNNESRISGVAVKIKNVTDTSQGEITLTSSNGLSYSKDDIMPGEYEVIVSGVNDNYKLVSSGYTKDGNAYKRNTNLNISSGQTVSENVLFERARVIFNIFEDMNYDGVKGSDKGFKRVSGVKLRVVKYGVDKEQDINSNGNNIITSLDTGDYTVKLEIPKSHNYKPTKNNTDWTLDTANSTADKDYYIYNGSSGVHLQAGETVNVAGGFYIPPKIRTRVWEDINGDGIQNDNKYLPNMNVTLSTSPEQSKTTNDSGEVAFEDLVPASYKLTVDKGGYDAFIEMRGLNNDTDCDVDADGTKSITLLSGDEVRIDAGVYKSINITGKVFIEKGNPDGNKNGSDIDNDKDVRIELFRKVNGTNNYANFASKNINGATYEFANDNHLRPGDYRLVATLPDGYLVGPTGENKFTQNGNVVSVNFSTTSDQDVAKDLSFYKGGRLKGSIYEDMDGNGTKEGSEANLSGVVVKLMVKGADGSYTEYRRVTSTDGTFDFNGLPSDDYKIVFEKDGFAVTGESENEYDLKVSQNEFTDLKVGMHRAATIGGKVYLDTGRDGVSSTDIGFVNVELQLYENGVATKKTSPDATGEYKFENLSPDKSYKVEVVIPDGKSHYKLSDKGVGRDNAIDFDIDSDGFSDEFVSSSSLEQKIDVGIYKTLEIKGTVRELVDPKKPIAGAVVELLDENGNAVLDTDGNAVKAVTSADGTYSFKGLKPAIYKVKVNSTYTDEQGNTVDYPQSVREINGKTAGNDTGVIEENFEPSKYRVTFSANPKVIVANGTDKAELTFTILDDNGTPISNKDVTFGAGEGTFENNSSTATTDANGSAKVTLIAPNYEGYFVPKTAKVLATVTLSNGITLKDDVYMTFEPSSIIGTLKDGKGNIRSGVEIKIKKVFDNITLSDDDARLTEYTDLGGSYRLYKDSKNGNKLTFEYAGTTDENGKYKIFIPYGEKEYDLKIVIPVDDSEDGENLEFTQTTSVGQLQQKGSDHHSNKTVAGSISLRDGATADVNNLSVEYVELAADESETDTVINAAMSGRTFHTDNSVKAGTTYKRKVYYEVNNGDDNVPNEKILVAEQKITVDNDGDMIIEDILIDPYGTITDAATGASIGGVKVTLHYDGGSKADDVVNLPKTNLGMSNNDNPQNSNASGQYGFMVFPNTDYYIIAEKAGYKPYDSRVDGGYKDDSTTLTKKISVGNKIVKWDFKMKKKQNNSSPIGNIARKEDNTPKEIGKVEIVQEISTDKNKIFVGDSIDVIVDYKNQGDSVSSALIKVELPDGVQVTDANGGTVKDGYIYFDIKDLKVDERRKLTFKVKAKKAETKGTLYKFDSVITDGKGSKNYSNESYTYVKVYPLSSVIDFPSYIYGRPDGGFHPEDFVTRAEIAAILVRNTYKDVNMAGAKKFSDVKEDDWYYDEVSRASAYGYFNGYANGEFKPNSAITREELAKVVANYFEIDASKEKSISKRFKDIDDSFASKEINAIARLQMIKGYLDGTFRPKNNIIRTETVKLFNRLLYRFPTPDEKNSFYDIDESHWAYGDVESSFRGATVTKTGDKITIKAKQKINKHYENYKKRLED